MAFLSFFLAEFLEEQKVWIFILMKSIVTTYDFMICAV